MIRRGGDVRLGTGGSFMLKRTIASLALVLASTAAVGCGGTAGAEPPATAETVTTKAPVAVAAHGPVKLFGEALGDVPLTASQRAALEQLASDAETRHAQTRTARQDLLTALAAQVEAGAIDRTALQPKIAAITAAMQASQPADRAAFEELHAVLTPDQRVAFVDAVQARAQQHMAGFKGHGGLHQWAQDLQLTDDQKAQIKAAVTQKMQAAGGPEAHDKGAKHLQGGGGGDAVMAAFKQDTFVLDQVQPAKDVGQMVGHMTDHFIGLAEAAVPILTPAQRTIAAQKLREHAASADGEGAELP
jgi:Spy/CpxP family protein refolding chaperone